MPGGVYSINARVNIKAPLNDPEMPDEITDQEIGPYLRSVTVTNSIDQPFGRFVIELSARPFKDGRSLADLIKPYSLVSIAFHRLGPGPAGTKEPEPILLGIVDSAEKHGDYSQASPHRRHFIKGRSLTALLTDHRWYFHHYLASQGVIRFPPDDRDLVAIRPSGELLRDEVALRVLGFLAIDEQLFDPSRRTPVALMDTAYRFFVVGERETLERSRDPFIKVRWSDSAATEPGVPLSIRLRFDAEEARAGYFDQRARLVRQFMPLQMPQSSCWDLLRYFSEEPFNELFSDTFGEDPRGAFVKIISRKPPWAGFIEYAAGKVRAGFVGGKGPSVGESLFEKQFGSWDWEKETVHVDNTDVISEPLLYRSIDGAYSLYDVQPQIFSNAGSKVEDRFFQMEIPPLFDESPASPSFIQRIGVRPLRLPIRSIATLRTDDKTNEEIGDIRQRALAYDRLLKDWYYRNPEFWRGTIMLKGRTSLRAGRRLVDVDRKREYYITSVVHRLDLGSDHPIYTTTCKVERGWDLNPNAL